MPRSALDIDTMHIIRVRGGCGKCYCVGFSVLYLAVDNKK